MDTPTLRGRTTRDGRTSACADLPRAWRNVARAVPEADALWSVLRAGHPELPERPWKVEHTQTWQNGDATYFVVWDETQASETMPEIDEGMLLVDAKRRLVEGAGLPVALTPVLHDFVTGQLATTADYRERHPQRYDVEASDSAGKTVDEAFMNLIEKD